MVIKVLGTGCAKCKATLELFQKVAKEMNVSPTIEKVEDIQEIMRYNVLSTPVVVIDEVIKAKGKVPTMSEVREFLEGA